MVPYCAKVPIFRKRARSVTLLLALLATFVSAALPQELPVIHYGTKEGLSSVFIISLAQGSDGRLWIAHSAGISVYDGSEFKNWYRGESGLLSGLPNSIVVDDDDVLWITFPEGGIQFMGKDEVIQTVPDPDGLIRNERVSSLQKMRNGSIVGIGKRGYYEISKTTIGGPHFPIDKGEGWINHILDLGKDRGLLFALEDGVYARNGQSTALLDLPYDQIGSRDIFTMARGISDDVWFLTSNGKLLRWNDEGYRTWDLNGGPENLSSAFFDMQVDPLGNLWIATGIGLFRWKDGRVERFTEEEGLSDIWINQILVDCEGILWLATEGGLDKISQMAFRNYRYKTDFPVNAVWPMVEMPDGKIWIGTNSGIVVMDEGGGHTIITEAEGLPERSIIDMAVTDDDRVWILSYNGIHQWDGGRFISYPYDLFNTIDLWGIHPVSERELWIYTSEGIFTLDPGENRITRHPISDRIAGSTDLNDLVAGENGEIYIVGRKIYVIRKDGSLDEIVLPEGHEETVAFTLVEDGDKIWLLTDEGLLLRDRETWRFFPVEDKILTDLIKVGDNEYWLGCNTGIAKFDGKDFFFFGYHDGVAVEEVATGATLIDRKGRIWFGGKNITLVYPEAIRKLPAGKPLITRVEMGKHGYSMPDRVDIPTSTKSIEFHFSTPSFYNEQDQVYRYRMADLESDWSEPSRDHSVRYANLSPGNYFFEVQSRQSHGDWDGSTTMLEVVVLPSYWQTNIAKLLFFLLLILGGFLISIMRVKRLERQKITLKGIMDNQTREIRIQRDQLAQLATFDDLTGLPNRRKFEERLETEILRSRRYNRSISLCLFDIDNFKEINDSYGHIIGDEILKLVALRGKEGTREIDFFARWGGDEFIFLMPETEMTWALEICDRLKERIGSITYNLDGSNSIRITISGGIATWQAWDGNGCNGEDLFRAADQALYRAKKSGGDTLCN
jgi:diguanylate cyclase (GGDEF)-like protein